MRFKWKHKKCKGEDGRGKIPNTVSIHERPAGAENRSCFGHWESDTVLGQRKTGCFGTHVERKSGFLIAFKIPDRQDNAFNKATTVLLKIFRKRLKRALPLIMAKSLLRISNLPDQQV